MTNKISSMEQDLIDMITSITNHRLILHDRKLLKRKEVDILIPDLHITFEFNGDFWHDIRKRPDIYYHQNKSLALMELGYGLYTIWGHDWVWNRQAVIDNIVRMINRDFDIQRTMTIDLSYNIIPLLDKRYTIEQITEPRPMYVNKKYGILNEQTRIQYETEYIVYDCGTAEVKFDI